mgnify:FL=1|jgi:hypothetical protein
MRSVITIGALSLSIILFIFANSIVINKNMRNNEVNNCLEKSIDYAMDMLDDIYKDYDYSELNEEEYINNIMVSFCNALNEKIHTDGDIEVKLINYDFVNGMIDILITENFSYHFLNMTGSISSNRTVKF